MATPFKDCELNRWRHVEKEYENGLTVAPFFAPIGIDFSIDDASTVHLPMSTSSERPDQVKDLSDDQILPILSLSECSSYSSDAKKVDYQINPLLAPSKKHTYNHGVREIYKLKCEEHGDLTYVIEESATQINCKACSKKLDAQKKKLSSFAVGMRKDEIGKMGEWNTAFASFIRVFAGNGSDR